MEFDNQSIEDMLNNPLKNVDARTGSTKKAKSTSRTSRAAAIKRTMQPADAERMEANHPLNDRVLSVEKNAISTDNNIDTIKRIIAEQNERIGKLEEELDILRNHLKGIPANDAQEEAADNS